MTVPCTVLVIHPGGLGDVLLARPALQELRRRYPGRELALVSGLEVGRLLQTCGEIDRLFPLEGGTLAELFGGTACLSPPVVDWLLRCDLALAWTSDPDGTLRSTLEQVGVPRVVIEPTVARGSSEALKAMVHQSTRLLGTIPNHSASDAAPRPLTLPEPLLQEGRGRLRAALATAGSLVDTVVAVHPGSGSRSKCVSPRLLAAVIDRLAAAGMAAVVLEGPADRSMVDALLSVCSRPVPVIGDRSVCAMAAVLTHVTLFIGHDSGLSHLAAALDRPTVALFGPTEPARWAPPHPSGTVRVVRGEACRCNTWQAVQDCQGRPCLPASGDHVLAACDELLKTRCIDLRKPHLVLPGRMC